MDEFLPGSQFQLIEFFFQKIFHRFHIVVGDLFDFLNPGSIVEAEIPDGLLKLFQSFAGNGHQLRQRQFTEGSEICSFNSYPVTDQGEFAEKIIQLFHFAAVAAINRRNGC